MDEGESFVLKKNERRLQFIVFAQSVILIGLFLLSLLVKITLLLNSLITGTAERHKCVTEPFSFILALKLYLIWTLCA